MSKLGTSRIFRNGRVSRSVGGWLLDTDILIHLRDGDEAVASQVEQLDAPPLMSAVSRAELESGVYRDPAWAEVRRPLVDLLIERLKVLPFDNAAAVAYGQIVAAAGYSRRKMLDRMIAATAIVQGAGLLTMNESDFRDIPGLSIQVWPRSPG